MRTPLKVMLALVSGIVLGMAVQAVAQFGNPRFDERSKNWNERSYERQMDQFRTPSPWQRPC